MFQNDVSSSRSSEDIFDPMPKMLGGNCFLCPLGFLKAKLCSKFEVSSLSSFEDMFDHMPKITGGT